MPSSIAPSKPVLVQWILDTRSWYPEATETRQLETHASRALALLTDPERAGVLKYYHVRDAKMSLASALLKHLVVSKLAPVPWRSSIITRDERTKPVFRDPATGIQPVSFNVTHQAGVVALVAVAHYQPGPSSLSSPVPSPDQSPSPAAHTPTSFASTTPDPSSHAQAQRGSGAAPPEVQVETGIDLVCTSERRTRDHRILEEQGWPAFVDMHADVFAPSEANYLKYQILSSIPGLIPFYPASSSSSKINDGKLRAFYALWAMREAYVKLTGEALLADWLRELEFVRFRPPVPGPETLNGELPRHNPSPSSSSSGPSRDPLRDLPTGSHNHQINDHSEEDVEKESEDAKEQEQILRTRQIEIRFRNKKVDDVNICLRSLGPDYMLCTAVRTPLRKEDGLGWDLGGYEVLDLEDVLTFGEEH